MTTTQTLFIVNGEDATAIPRLAQSHSEFKEAWVRDLIFKTPEVLPVHEMLRDAGAFCPIAIEVPLGKAGIVDVLGVTTGGYPVVVETKLWRNPQARLVRPNLSRSSGRLAARGFDLPRGGGAAARDPAGRMPD